MTRVAREVGVFAFFLALSVILTWPLVRDMSHLASDLGDPLLVTAIVDWDCYALTHAPLSIYHAPWFVPAKFPLAFSENFIGIAILVLPFWLAGLPPITVYNIAMLIGFALSGYGAYVLARTCRTSFLAAIAAGVLYAFVPFKFDHLAHLQIVSSGWLPLMFAALLLYWRTPSRGRAALLAGAFVMNGLTNIHYLLFGGLTLVLTIGFLALVDRSHDRRFWAMLAIALGIAGAVLLPFLIPYRILSHTYGMHRGVGETTLGSAVPMDWLVASWRSRWYGEISAQEYRHAERLLFPGLVPLVLAGAAFLLRRRAMTQGDDPAPMTARQGRIVRWLDALMVVCIFVAYFGIVSPEVRWTMNGEQILAFSSAGIPLTILVAAAIARCSIRFPRWLTRRETTLPRIFNESRFTHAELAAALWIVIGVLGSFGLNVFFHQFLYRVVQAFQSVRAPARWAVIAYIGLAIWAAMGMDEIVRRVKSQWRQRVAASALVVLAIIDMLPMIRWERAITSPAPVYVWAKENHLPGPLLELPMSGNGVEFFYLFSQTFHRIPMMNGTSGFEPPLHLRLRADGEEYKMNAADTALIEKSGARYVVIHGDWLRYQRDPVFRWLRPELAAGRLSFVRRFDYGQNGDWLFAVTRNAPDWQRFRAPEVPDQAGFTPSQNLGRFLSAQKVYSASTFGYVDTPKAWTEVRGPLAINGWALSPAGIQRVIVHFDNDRQQFDAQLFPRPDIAHYFNDWYPNPERAGFRFTMPTRPRGVHLANDFQIEIIDGEGRSTWLPDFPIWWYR